MSWDPIWDQVFASREWGRYPPLELVRFVARHYYGSDPRGAVRILEVGCGTGANLWYLAREGFNAWGVDGSASALAKAADRLRQEGLRADLRQGDICDLSQIYAAGTFDAVIDVACLWCNPADDVRRIARQIFEVLAPGGRVFSMLLAQGSYGEELGREVAPATFTDIPDGPLAGTGVNHFFSESEARRVFEDFASLKVEYTVRSMDAQTHLLKLWVVEGIRT